MDINANIFRFHAGQLDRCSDGVRVGILLQVQSARKTTSAEAPHTWGSEDIPWSESIQGARGDVAGTNIRPRAARTEEPRAQSVIKETFELGEGIVKESCQRHVSGLLVRYGVRWLLEWACSIKGFYMASLTFADEVIGDVSTRKNFLRRSIDNKVTAQLATHTGGRTSPDRDMTLYQRRRLPGQFKSGTKIRLVPNK